MKFILIALVFVVALTITSRVFAGDFMPPAEAAQRVADGTAVLIDVRERFQVANAGGFKHWKSAGLPVRSVEQD